MKTAKTIALPFLRIFLALWFLLNLSLAYFTALTGDEAYYVMFSQQLDWGYFDHPPMVAVFIYLGRFIADGELGVRLLTVITNTLSLGIMASFLPIRSDKKEVLLFAALATSLTLFAVYGFLTAPDAPLIFFSSLFIWIIKRYLQKNDWRYVLPLALSMAAMLYSKYHGILLILFFVMANLQLLKKPSFYAAALLGVLFFMPHLWWQYEQGFPSLTYHLSAHSIDNWQWKFIFEYPFYQILVLGPLASIPIFIVMYTYKVQDAFERTLRSFFWGFLLFFFFMAFKSHVEPHWTVLIALPVLILVPKYYATHSPAKWVINLIYGNAILLLITKLILLYPELNMTDFHGHKKWAGAIIEKSEGHPVVFYGSYQYASLLEFYTGVTANSYNPHYYHLTQFDRWQKENELRHQKVLFVSKNKIAHYNDSLETVKGRFYSYWITDYYSVQNLGISIIEKVKKIQATEAFTLEISVSNPYNFAIDLRNKKYTVGFSYTAINEKEQHFNGKPILSPNNNTIPALGSKHFTWRFPALPKGKYTLQLIQNSPHHPPGMGSNFVDIISK